MPIENRIKEILRMKETQEIFSVELEPSNSVAQEVQALGLLVSIS